MVDIIRRIDDLIDDVVDCRDGPGQSERKKQAEKDTLRLEKRKKISVEKKEGSAAYKNRGTAGPSLQAQGSEVGVQPLFTFRA
jgi:hypothetical protein